MPEAVTAVQPNKPRVLVCVNNQVSMRSATLSLRRDVAEPKMFCIALIDKYAFTRECITRSLRALDPGIEIFPLSDPSEMEKLTCKVNTILYHCPCYKTVEFDTPLWRDLMLIAPTIILSGEKDPDVIIEIFEQGARGYIPIESTTVELTLGILSLVKAGGTFVPLGVLPLPGMASHAPQHAAGQFTARERSVLALLKRGKANKIIAHELTMSESTAKVHIRNIMRKMNAKNRTEVVCRVLAGQTRGGEFESSQKLTIGKQPVALPITHI